MDIKGQEELYKILSDKKLYTKSFDEFKSQFSVPEGQAKLYQGMVDKGLYKKSQKDFTNQFFGAEKKNPIQPSSIVKATDLPQVLEKPKSSSGGGMVAMAPTSESELPQPKPGQSQGALLIPPKEVKLPSTGTLKGVQDLSNYDVTKKGWFNPNADIKIDIPVVRKKTLQASKDLAQQAKSLDQESTLLDNEIAASREYAKKNSNDPLLQQKSRDLDDKIDLYNKKLRQFKVDRFNVNQDRAELKKASVQNFINKKDEGNFLGATWNSIVEGYTKIGQAQARIAIDLGIELLDKIGKPWAPANTKLTKDEAKKEVINQMMPTIAKGYEQVKDKGTSKEYIEAQKASGILPKAWFGAMESIPVMASGPGLGGTIPRFVTGASLAYQYANEDLDNNPATESMDENERKKITVPIAVIGGILEELGFRTLIGKNKPALISLVNLIIKELPIDAGIETIKQVSKQVLKKPAAQVIASGSGKLAVAYLGEAETGGAQKISDFAIKEIYDKANKLNLFKNPKFFSNEFLSKIAEDANVEGVGGVMMRAIGIGASSAMSVKGVEGMSDKEYKAWTDLASDTDQIKLYLTKIATDVSSGRITQEEGEKRIDIIQKATEIVNQIPNDLSIPDQKKAYAIIADNLKIETKIKELNDYMAGKNTNLVANINAEIAKLQKQIEKNNQELSKIPQNAVQEQTTGEVPIQPEAGTSLQVAEGESQAEPQGPTEEGKVATQESKELKVQSDKVEDILGVSEQDADVLSVIYNADLTKAEKAIAWRQYKRGVMNLQNVKNLAGVIDLEQFNKTGDIGKWARATLAFQKNKSGKFNVEDINFEEIPAEEVKVEEVITPTEEVKAEVVVPTEEEFVYETIPENKEQWVGDFEIIDNRGGKADLEKIGKEGNWYVVNNITGRLLMATSKSDAQDIINNADDYDFGQGETFTRPVEVVTPTEEVTTETIQPTEPISPQQKTEQTNALQKGIDAVNKGLKRGRPRKEAIEGGISFMQQTIAYEEADDITREQMVRNINKEFGVKEKRAPSVEKLGLKEKAKKVLIDSKKLLDERLVEIDQSIKEGQRNFKTAVKDLATDIKAMLPKGVFSTSQVKVITNAMASNLLNPKLRQDAVNRVIRVVNNVAEATKLKEVYNLRSKIKSAKKDGLSPELVNIANNFVEIDPRYIDNIDKHLEKAKEIFDAVKAVKVVKNKETGEKELSPREIIDYQSTQDYVEKQLEKQEEIIKDALLQQYSDLVDEGKISDAMSIQQIKAYIKELEEGKPKDDEKDKLIMDYAQASFDESKEELEEQIEDGDIDPEDLPLIEGFTKMDLSSMSPMQAYQVAEALMNYRMNGSTSNMGKLLDNYIGAFGSKFITDQISREGVVNVGGTRFKRYQVIGKAIDKIVQLLSGGRLNPETEKISKAYSDLWLELNSTVDNLGVTYFGPTNWKAIKEAAGLDRIIQGVVERKIIVDQFEKEIYDKYKNKKIAGNAFFTAKSSNMLGIIANLYRETSDPDKQETYFTDRKTILKETIDYLVNSKNKSDQAQGKLLQEIYDELGIEDATSGQEVFDNSDPVAQEAITDFINKFKQYYPQFSKIAQEQFNVLLGQDNNYTGDSWNRVDKAAQTSEDKLFKKGNFRMNTDIVDTETIGRFTKPKYPSKLPKKDGRATRIANYDFIKNNVNAFAEIVNTVKTIGGVNQYTGFMDSPNFQKLITDEDSRNLFKDRIDYNVGLYQMNENLGMQNKNIKKFVNSAMIRLGSRIGTRVGLSSMESVFTQSLPILTNTGLNLKNPGYLLTALQYLENADMKDFLNNINYGIRERGNSAQTNIDYADNMLEKGDYSTPDKTIETLNKVSKFWVNDVLVGTDVLTAKVTWMAYYMDELAKKEGVNPVEINWKNHKVNDEAAKYAEYMVQREQNINLPESGGKLWSSKDSGLKLIRMMMPFASFTTSQKDKIKTNMSVLFADKNIATKEDKIAAARSVVASVGEQWVFNGLKSLIAEQLTVGAYRIVGKKETDEEKKLREKKAKYKTYADLYESLNGTIPLIENEVASITNNLLLEKLEDLYSGKTKDKKPIKYPFGEELAPKTQRQLKAERLKKEIKKPFKFYESKEAPAPETTARLVGGVTMVAYDAWSKIVQEIPDIVAGGMENESGDKIKFTQEEINKLKVANAFKIGAALGLGVSREFKTIANNATKIIKENATMRYKRRKAEQKRMNAEMNN